MTDRTFKTSRGSAEVEVEVEPGVQVAEEEEMEGKKFKMRVLPSLYVFKRATLICVIFIFAGSASKRTSVLEKAARAAKRKAAAATGGAAGKRTRSTYVIPDSPPDDAKRKAEGGIEAIPIHFAPPEGVKGASGQSSSRAGKGVEGSGRTTMTIDIPSDFLADDVLTVRSVFPNLEQFHLPAQRERMEKSEIEDLDAAVAGASFLVRSITVRFRCFCRTFSD